MKKIKYRVINRKTGRLLPMPKRTRNLMKRLYGKGSAYLSGGKR